MRSFDPDNTVFQGGSYSTINTVRGQVPTDGIAAVSATSFAGDHYNVLTGQQATVLYLSTDPNAVVYTAGFRNSNPYDFAASNQQSGYSKTADQAIGIVLDAGTLASGESKTFTYYTALSTNSSVTAIMRDINTPSVTEGSPGASIGVVSAHDPNPGDTLTFSVSDPRFEIVDSGGANTLKLQDGISLDYSVETSVTMTITVTDSSSASLAKAFTVNVLEGTVAPEEM
jgi:hypothetical protein